MIERMSSADPSRSDDRFRVTYRLATSDAAEARTVAEGIALEQTVELPSDVVPAGFIEDVMVGRVDAIEGAADHHLATLSYALETVGDGFAQFLNVVFGNSSMQPGLKVVGIDPGDALPRTFTGPRFGIEGVRELAGAPKGGMICPVLKPMGLTPDALAAIAGRCALAGADFVKEDHGLANQPTAPFRARVEATAEAVGEANARTGGRTLYLPNLSGAPDTLVADAMFAKACGAGGVMISPGLYGFGAIWRLASDPDFDLPIMFHPALLGSFVVSPDVGFSHGVMFGTLPRLAGADIAIFVNVGGRFGFSAEQCRDIAHACRTPAGEAVGTGGRASGRTILPCPGGGMTVDRAPDMLAMYGDDVVHLLGGGLLRYGARIGDGIAEMRTALGR